MLENISLIAQSAIRIEKNKKVIYFDPYKIEKETNDADYIFITHSHYDHFSVDDINKIKKGDTKFIAPKDLKEQLNKITNNILLVEPDNNYTIDNIKFLTVPAYNLNKDFHKKEYKWVGYIIDFFETKIYVSGDTDDIDDLHNIKCDIAFVPIGGTYTMTAEEAANLIRNIKTKIAIPTHYRTIVGSDEDAKRFKELLNEIDVRILM